MILGCGRIVILLSEHHEELMRVKFLNDYCLKSVNLVCQFLHIIDQKKKVVCLNSFDISQLQVQSPLLL